MRDTEGRLAKQRKFTVDTSSKEETINANILELNTNILQLTKDSDDATFKTQVTNRASKTGFTEEIKDAFVKNHGTEKDSITIEELKDEPSETANRNSHFIITHKEGWKWHAKSALHGKIISLGTPFNEFAHYKLNEHLGIGPRCYGFVSKEGVVMIFTEDLNYRSLKGIDKKVSFSDNKKSNKFESPPVRKQDEAHLLTAQIAIKLLPLLDIKKNLGNTGFKSSYEIGKEMDKKEKLFIVDFALNAFAKWPLDIKTYADSLARILKPASEQPESEQPASEQPASEQPASEQPASEQPERKKPKNIFTFVGSPEVLEKALKKLFLDDDGEIKKFKNSIKKAFKEARELLESYEIEDPKTQDPKTGDTETVNKDFKQPHLNALTTQENKLLERLNTFLENEAIKTFLKEAGPKHKEEQIEKKKLKEAKLEKEIPPKDLSPADNSHTQLSELQQPGPSLH